MLATAGDWDICGVTVLDEPAISGPRLNRTI
jgi:hypothetical protein